MMIGVQSTILIPVLTSEPIVGQWRRQYDDSALRGIPPHITLLFPFVHPQSIDERVLNTLSLLFQSIKPFQFTLEKIRTFPNVIYLMPSPRKPFIKLTTLIVEKYPDAPPYEGKYPAINPHLTLAQLSDKDDFSGILNTIKKELPPKLPIKTIAKEAWLMEKDKNNYWRIKYKFPF